MSGIAEFLLMVRWLRSIDSLIISRLRSAVILLFSSMIQSFFNAFVLSFSSFCGLNPTPAEGTIGANCVRITMQR
jgi:hypothetical protein